MIKHCCIIKDCATCAAEVIQNTIRNDWNMNNETGNVLEEVTVL